MLEHELGHVLGLSDNDQAGDLMDITLGLGVSRSPDGSDVMTIGGASTNPAPTAPAVVPTRAPQPVLHDGSVSVSVATMDAALASIVGNDDTPDSALKPSTPSASMGPVPGPGVSLRTKTRTLDPSRPYPHRTAGSLFPRKGRGMGEAGARKARISGRVQGDSE